MHQMQWQAHKKCSSPSLPNSTKATKAYGGIREEEQKRKSTKEPQDLDPICSPHLEERLIGGNVDLDLLSLFPQKDARIMGGRGRNGKLFKDNNGGERIGRVVRTKEEEGSYLKLSQNPAVGVFSRTADTTGGPSGTTARAEDLLESCRWRGFPGHRYYRWSPKTQI